MPPLQVLKSADDTLVQRLDQRCSVFRQVDCPHLAAAGHQGVLRWVCRAVVEEENGFLLHALLSEVILHAWNKVPVEPVLEDSGRHPCVAAVRIYHWQDLQPHMVEATANK